MLRKYHGYNVYLHNFSYFDSIFLIESLSSLGDIKLIKRDNRIIKLTLSFQAKASTYSLYFRDSLLLLPDSLDNLSKSFNIDTPKSHFPIFFLNRPDLDWGYAGSLPEASYYPAWGKSTNFFEKTYNKLRLEANQADKAWNLREELAKYCENDTIALYKVLTNFQREIY